jgi:hypothetical protein
MERSVKPILPLVLCLLLALPAAAQTEPDAAYISYDSVVAGSISDDIFYEWWFIQASEGDVMMVEMAAADGLAPLIGLLDPNGDLIARSADGEVNGTALMEYTLPVTGLYTIVATRVDNQRGTTSGSYSLRTRQISAGAGRDRPYQQVVFRCRDMNVTNVATLEFAEDLATAGFYRINIYGLDDFVPVIRVYLEGVDLTDCSSDSQAMGGHSFTLPGEETIVVEGDRLNQAAQLTISGAAHAGRLCEYRPGAAGRPYPAAGLHGGGQERTA